VAKCCLCGEPPPDTTTLSCEHQACQACLRTYILAAIGGKQAVGIACPTCKTELSPATIQSLLSPAEFDTFLEATLMAFIETDSFSFVCPNAQCQLPISLQPREVSSAAAPVPPGELDQDGRMLTTEAWRHFQEYRVR
jgi:hypothetical protein